MWLFQIILGMANIAIGFYNLWLFLAHGNSFSLLVALATFTVGAWIIVLGVRARR